MDSFNKVKEDLEEYKEEIANRYPSPTNPLRQQATNRPESRRFWRFTHRHKQEEHHKCSNGRKTILEGSGYSNKVFESISLQAFYSPAIRETMTIWEKYGVFQTSEAALEAVNNIKNLHPRIRSWKTAKILQRLSSNWSKRDDIQNQLNKRKMETMKHNDFKERMEENPENNFVSNKIIDDKTMEELVKETELNWSKAAEYTRYETEAPPIIMDNLVEGDHLSTNAATMRASGPSNDMRILTCYLDKATGKWVESRRASHPYIKVNMTKIDPHRKNQAESETKQLCVMADSGAMCTLLTFDTCRQMGIVPESLPTSTACITGVGGCELKSKVRI